jgi:hypothetical protein
MTQTLHPFDYAPADEGALRYSVGQALAGSCLSYLHDHMEFVSGSDKEDGAVVNPYSVFFLDSPVIGVGTLLVVWEEGKEGQQEPVTVSFSTSKAIFARMGEILRFNSQRMHNRNSIDAIILDETAVEVGQWLLIQLDETIADALREVPDLSISRISAGEGDFEHGAGGIVTTTPEHMPALIALLDDLRQQVAKEAEWPAPDALKVGAHPPTPRYISPGFPWYFD